MLLTRVAKRQILGASQPLRATLSAPGHPVGDPLRDFVSNDVGDGAGRRHGLADR